MHRKADIESDAHLESLIPRTREVAGRLDILVNNAGVSDYATIENMTDDCFDRTLRHYFVVPLKLTRAAIPVMRVQGAGWIVNVGSVTAQRPLTPFDEFSIHGDANVYAAIKAALARLTQGMAAELQSANIAVNLVAPSTAIRTPSAVRYIPGDYPGVPVYGLDGRERLPAPVVPAYAHPEIMDAGE